MTRVIAIVSGKGGVGKTTLTANLGAALASEFGKEVVIVDCNFTTSHLSLYLGMYYCPVTLNTVIRGEAPLNDAMYPHPSGMKVIPAGLSLKDLSGVDFMDLEKVTKNLFGRADIVILDSAPGLGREAMATMRAADEILFVTNPHLPAAMDVIRCNEVIKYLGKKTLGVALNMADGHSEFNKEQLERLTELPVIATIPHDRAVLKALEARVPVVVYRPHAPASRAFRKLAAWVLNVKYKEKSTAFHRLVEWMRSTMG